MIICYHLHLGDHTPPVESPFDEFSLSSWPTQPYHPYSLTLAPSMPTPDSQSLAGDTSPSRNATCADKEAVGENEASPIPMFDKSASCDRVGCQ